MKKKNARRFLVKNQCKIIVGAITTPSFWRFVHKCREVLRPELSADERVAKMFSNSSM